MTVEGAREAQTLAKTDSGEEAATKNLREGIWSGTTGSPDLTPGGGPKSDRDAKYEGNGAVCGSTAYDKDLAHNSLIERRELRELSNDSLISARSTQFLLPVPGAVNIDLRFPLAAKIDIRVKQPDGSSKYYEEYPTPFTSPDPKFAKIAGPIWNFDPVTNERIGTAPLAHDSAEYQEAYDALTWLRETYTPKKILFGDVPNCTK